MDELLKLKKDKSKNFGLARQNYSGIGFSSGIGSAGSKGGDTSQGGSGAAFLKTGGDTMIGPIAYFPKAVIISTGAIDVGDGTSGFSSRVVVTGEGGADDDLDTISNPHHAGQMLYLQSIATTAITLKHGTGNIWTPDGSDFVMANGQIAVLQWDTVVNANKWVLLTTTSGGADNLGNHIATQNLDMSGFQVTLCGGISMINSTSAIGDATNYVDDLYVGKVRLQEESIVNNIPMITAYTYASTKDSMVLNFDTGGRMEVRELNSMKLRVDNSGITTLGTITAGSSIAAGSHFLASAGTAYFDTSSSILLDSDGTVTVNGEDGITMLVDGFSDDMNLNVTGTNGILNLTASGTTSKISINALAASSNGIVDINATKEILLDATAIRVYGKLEYQADNTTYIDLASGTGDIEIKTGGSSDPINITASGSGSTVNITSTLSDVIITGGNLTAIKGGSFTGFSVTSSGTSFLGTGSGDIFVNDDLDISATKRVDFGASTGSAGSLLGYIKVKVSGTERLVPYYAV